MGDLGQETFIRLRDGVRIRYRRSEAPPPYEYAVTLEILEDTEWTEIALWDNAHDRNEHHEHEYTREQGKRPAKILKYATINEAITAAIKKATEEWQRILTSWSESR